LKKPEVPEEPEDPEVFETFFKKKKFIIKFTLT
jgi:hypothetical protein